MHGGTRHLSEWAVSRRKRAFDLLAVLLIAPVALLAIGAAALASAIIFRAQPFFVQHRRGVGGELFRVVKIRSLPTDFGRNVGKHQLDGVQLHWFSKVLRSSHIDELPQLYNVLRGQMSVVGPRPMIDEVLERLPDDAVESRLQARPGMTGIWQVSTMGNQSLDLCPQLDAWYVAHGTAAVDVRVLFWTIATALRGSRHEPEALLQRYAPTGHCECVERATPRTVSLARRAPFAAEASRVTLVDQLVDEMPHVLGADVSKAS